MDYLPIFIFAILLAGLFSILTDVGHGPRLRANGITAHEFSEPPDTCRAKAIRRALQNVNCRVIRWSYSENKS